MVESHGTRQRRDGALGSDIGGSIRDAHVRGGGGRIDDNASALPLHDGYGVFAAEEHALHVDGHQGIPIRLGGVDHGACKAIAGVVDENVEAAVLGDGTLDHPGDFALPAHVHRQRRGAIAGSADLVHDALRRRGVPIRYDNRGALGCEELRRLMPDAGSGTCDDCDLAFQFHLEPRVDFHARPHLVTVSRERTAAGGGRPAETARLPLIAGCLRPMRTRPR